MRDVKNHPFFLQSPSMTGDWTCLRKNPEEGGREPPFVPQLDGECDTTYFDDFSNPEDMAMYQDVQNKQKEMAELVSQPDPDKDGENRGPPRSAFVGFTFRLYKYKNQKCGYPDFRLQK